MVGRLFKKVEINKEKFDKLNQLDRIEFRQKWDNIEKNHKHISLPWFVNFIFLVIGYIILLGISSYSINETIMINTLQLIRPVCNLAIFFSIIIVIFNSIFNIRTEKQKQILIDEYFRVVINNKGSKK